MKKVIQILALAMTTICAAAQTTDLNKLQYGSHYYAYPWTFTEAPELTPAPDGYAPFHIEHYGRHGSRWHIGDKNYRRPVEILEVAERNGKLTQRGVELLQQLRQILAASIGHDGELTPLGAIQHRGIAQRMVRNFPEVFADTSYVTARSSMVIRCILSMDNELQELARCNPGLRITSDASVGDMPLLGRDNYPGDTIYYNQMLKNGQMALAAFRHSHHTGRDYTSRIFNDPKFVEDSVPVSDLFEFLFNVATNAQSLDYSPYPQYAPYDLFTDRELRDMWMYNNASSFIRFGNTAITDHLMPLRQAGLLRSIIASVDTAVVSDRTGANMRFGHDTVLMPLTVLLELGHYGREYNDLEDLWQQWHNYEVFPMAGNIQLVFYRRIGDNDADNVLVKALLNEREVSLPVQPVYGCYYPWKELREYYLGKLGDQAL